GLGMTALGAMKVATCPKTGAPSHNKYAAVSGALGSALPWHQSNRAKADHPISPTPVGTRLAP
ncbi:MAG: hypothetical protein WCF34_12755, partial [Pseudolabrys sp.]